MRAHRVARAATLVVAGLWLSGSATRAQPARGHDPYAAVARASPEIPTAPPRARSAEDATRRAMVAASAGQVVVTVGEVEDRLARESESSGLEGRRRIARELLLGALLAEEAERRGLADHPEVRAAERRALVQVLLEEDFAVDHFEAEAPAIERAPPTRRAFVRFAPSRAAAEAIRRELSGPSLSEIARAELEPVTGEPHPAGDLGFVAEEPRPNEAALAPGLRRALFALESYGDVSAVVPAGRVFGVVVFGGEQGEVEPQPADDTAARWAARERAIAALTTRLRAEHLRDVDPVPLYSLILDPRPPAEDRPTPASAATGSSVSTEVPMDSEPARLGGLEERR